MNKKKQGHSHCPIHTMTYNPTQIFKPLTFRKKVPKQITVVTKYVKGNSKFHQESLQ